VPAAGRIDPGVDGPARRPLVTRLRRAIAHAIWRVFNPIALRFGAGRASWWVILETTGRRSGRPIHTPLARGPMTETTLWLVSVHGRQANFVKNLVKRPEVRVKHRRRWRSGRATVEPLDPRRLREFNFYARSGPRSLGIDPVLVRVEFD
jgi:deazaflavin-dependent oxidoreductase (nitroreductase family)